MKMLIRKSEGQIILVVAISLVVLLALVGLALDIGIAYGVKAKLNAAVDAAALAACRAKSSGATDSESSTAATNLFHVNFPSGYLGVKTVPDPNTSTATVNGEWVVTVTATVDSPAYFARVLGWKKFPVHALAEANKPSLDLSLVIDTTASMNSVFSTVKNRAEDFVDRFNETTDRVALVPFATSVGVDGSGKLTDGVEIKIDSAGFSKDAVKNAIKKLNAGGNTASEVGMRIALDQLNKVNAPAGRRVIVFFSDGAPNTFSGIFPLTTGDTADGNLFSETWNSRPPPRPHTLFDPNYTYKNKKDLGITLQSIPANGGGNIMGGKMLPLIPVAGKRYLNGSCNGTAACLKCDANKAARNMLENIASIARNQGVVIYSLALGSLLDAPDIDYADCPETWAEQGSTIMRRIANTKDSDTYNPLQPTGLYCHAVTIDELGPCFDAISKAILHLTK